MPGRTTAVGPLLQRTVAVAPMRTAIMTTAGLARNTADCSSASVAASNADGRPAARRQAIAPITHMLAIVFIVLLQDSPPLSPLLDIVADALGP